MLRNHGGSKGAVPETAESCILLAVGEDNVLDERSKSDNASISVVETHLSLSNVTIQNEGVWAVCGDAQVSERMAKGCSAHTPLND